MKRHKYDDIRSELRDTWFAPDPAAKTRLKAELGIDSHGGSTGAERRFGVIFRAALAAAAVLVCVANVGSVHTEYLNRYPAPAVVAWVADSESALATEE